VEKRIAFFPGSFDPFTLGHLNTVERGAKLFDELIIGIVTNTNKSSLFTKDEKLKLTQEAVSHLKNVRVITQDIGLTVDIAASYGSKFMIRGIRGVKDYEYERNIAFMNQQLNGEIESVFLLADEKYSNISSSMIKEIAKFDGDVSNFLPETINRALVSKYKNLG